MTLSRSYHFLRVSIMSNEIAARTARDGAKAMQLSAYDDMLRQQTHGAQSSTVTVGYVRCPLCKVPKHSQKRYSLGRGLRMHFQAAHPEVEDPSEWLNAAEERAAAGEVSDSRGTDKHAGKKPPMPPGLLAAQNGDLAALQALHNSGGWCPEETDHNGSSAIHWAAGGGHLLIVQWLVEELCPGAAVAPVSKRKRRDGRQAIHWAARNNQVAVLEYLLGRSCQDGASAVDVEARTFDGTTPLHLACFGKATDACTLLVSLGAQVNTVNDWGCNAAHWAAMGGSVAVMELVKEKGAAFSLLQKEGHSPLHKAAQRGNTEAVDWLLSGPISSSEDRKASGGEDTCGFKPSAIAMVAGHNDCHELLSAAGC